MTESEIIGKRLHALRKAKGLSQLDLASQSGVSFRTIQAIEGGSGNPTIQSLIALSTTLKHDLVLFDIENYVSKEEAQKNLTLLAGLNSLIGPHRPLLEQLAADPDCIKGVYAAAGIHPEEPAKKGKMTQA